MHSFARTRARRAGIFLLVVTLVWGLSASCAGKAGAHVGLVKLGTSGHVVSFGALPAASAFDGYPCKGGGDVQCPTWNSCSKLASCTGDAPDPSIVRSGADYWAFSTGTALGNNIQVLVSPHLTSGWHPLNSGPGGGWNRFGSSPFPGGAGLGSWERLGSETSPVVVNVKGRWLMYYDAVNKSTGRFCIGVAVGPRVPTSDSDHVSPVFFSSGGPLECRAPAPSPQDGVIDPDVYVDPLTNAVTLIFKSNDGSSSAPAYIDSEPLGAGGLSVKGAASVLFSNNTVLHHWEKTVENPSVVKVGGAYALLFSGGRWDSSGYAEGVAWCANLTSACQESEAGPVLSKYGDVAGPGGGAWFVDRGSVWLVYAAWTKGCVGYSNTACGAGRKMYVTGVTLR